MKNKNFSEEIAMHAAFMMGGLHEAGYSECAKVWGLGYLELVQCLTSYAPLITKLRDALGSLHFPGVFEYEVSSPFGNWFGKYIIFHGGDAPPKKEVIAWLSIEVETFFCAERMFADEIASVRNIIQDVMAKEDIDPEPFTYQGRECKLVYAQHYVQLDAHAWGHISGWELHDANGSVVISGHPGKVRSKEDSQKALFPTKKALVDYIESDVHAVSLIAKAIQAKCAGLNCWQTAAFIDFDIVAGVNNLVRGTEGAYTELRMTAIVEGGVIASWYHDLVADVVANDEHSGLYENEGGHIPEDHRANSVTLLASFKAALESVAGCEVRCENDENDTPAAPAMR